MDGTDEVVGDAIWLLATTRAVVRATTGRTEPGAIAGRVVDALGDAGTYAWIGTHGEPQETIRILATSADEQSRELLSWGDSGEFDVSETATARALDEGRPQFGSLEADPEYQHLRENHEIPAAETGASVPLEEGPDEHGVLHWYAGRDLTGAAVRETVVELGELVTDALVAAEQRRELGRERERLETLRSNLSHDLGNPLNLGAGRLNLAREECNSEHLDHVERAFDQIDALVDESLSFVAVSKPVESVERVSLPAVAESCWERVGTERASLSVADLTITAETQRLRRILAELFENAVVHTDGAVEVRVEPLSEGGFAVVDTGDGIPEDHREYVFDRGYTTTDDREGNGLAVVAAAARAHGWEARLGEGGEGTRIEVKTTPW
jgi:signal transduction histidine kinase